MQDIIMMLPEKFRRPGANEIEIASAARKIGRSLPSDYLEFIHVSNGAEGFVRPNEYLQLFSVGDLAEINVAACIHEFAPDLLIFGSNGQGKSYAFDFRQQNVPVVCFDDSQMSRESASVVANNFRDFVQKLAGA